MLRSHAIAAVFKRNVASYFSGVLGYLFIVVFVVAGALLAFKSEFFAANQANLDQLTAWYPLLLVFIVPAVTMTAWADERKLGTDELLFTLPATDVEILLGKYLAVLAVYSAALLFSLTHAWTLAYLGDPDGWQIATTYLGYWLAGAALIGAGLFASSLTSSATVAFVVGALFCVAPVGLELIPDLPDWLRSLTIGEQLRYFTLGIIPISGVLYFLSLIAFMLYLNVVMIGRRHWPSQQDGWAWLDWALTCGLGILWGAACAFARYLRARGQASESQLATYDVVGQWLLAAFIAAVIFLVLKLTFGGVRGRHCAVRALSLAAALIGLNYIAGQAAGRIDMTEEKLFTLSETTREVLRRIDPEKPVTIQAYLSPHVPQEYVEVHRRLSGLLRQIDSDGGRAVDVQINDIEPSSEESEQAQQAGIRSRRVQTERGGKVTTEDVFLGAIIQGPYSEVIVPFFDIGTSVEYELTRSIGTVSDAERLTIGVLTTDAKVMGGFDMSTFRQSAEWRIVQELRKQYKVEEVPADHPILDKIDVLIAVLPSSLTEPQMENFLNYVRSGKPALVFDDPLPVFDRGRGVQFAPLQPKPQQGGGMMGMQQPSEPKADGGRLTGLMSLLQSAWERYGASDRGRPAGEDFLVFDAFNPHPEFSDVVRPELVFITPKSGTATAFNPDHKATSGLQELMAWFPGTIRPREGGAVEFTPLLRTGSKQSGLLDWGEITENHPFFGMQIKDDPVRRFDGAAHVIAAQIQSKEGASQKLNVIFVADTDLISDDLFRIQEGQLYGLKIDNVTFVLNAVDSLAGNDEYIALRKRRPQLRTLETIEKQKDAFKVELNRQIQDAEQLAKDRLEKAQSQFDAAAARIENDTSLDPRTKQQLLQLAQRDAQNVLDEETQEITQEKQHQIEQLRASTNRKVAARERVAWLLGVLLPPIPAVLLMIIVLSIRLLNETTGVSPDRLVRR